MYLMIQNKGEAGPEAFTLLGDSPTRNCGEEGLIGQFGSGTKHAINLLLRKNIPFFIYCGKTRLEFFIKTTIIKDAHGEHEAYKIMCRLSGDRSKTIDCNWVLGFGQIDWDETHMALREFVSNAIDCTTLNDDDDGLEVKPEPNKRAKAGYTRVFIDWSNTDVQEFYQTLGTRFLHFCLNPELAKKKFIVATHGGAPRVYRNGVLIQQLMSSKPSVFDYNFTAGQISIDECRNSSEYSLRAEIARSLGKADKETLKILFASFGDGERYEAGLDEYYLSESVYGEPKGEWVEAWDELTGGSVLTSETLASSPLADHVRAKGYNVKTLPETFVRAAKSKGVRTVVDVLGVAAAAGKIECEVTPEAEAAVAEVWGWCETAGLTCEKPCPEAACFKQIMDGESECLGYHTPGSGKVHIREDVGGKLALKTAIEEVTHYITGSIDGSRDLQNFAFDMIVEICT